MLKIGDFSKFGRVSIKALRYYDEIGLLKPVTVDQLTGYRYYSADQLVRLNRIVGLKDLGLSLDEISCMLKDNLPTYKLMELLQAKQKEIIDRLREEEARLKRVEEWLKKIEKEGAMPDYDVVIKKIEAQTVASVRDVIPTYGDIGRLFGLLGPFLGRHRVKVTGPAMAIYYDHEYREKGVDVEVAVPVAGNVTGTQKVTIGQLPGVEQAACLIHKGPYDKFHLAYKALMAWVEANKYQIIGPNREIYLKGPGRFIKGNPAEYITEIQLPVKKAEDVPVMN
jgi:effector-binding domain-containing protein